LLLLGYLIFCHGCHGEDVDDELCVPTPTERKSEARNPKSERKSNTKEENRKALTSALSDF